MLEFRTVRNPIQVKQVLNAYDPLKDTWIVSDLKSKQEIQNASVERYGFFTDDSIMRASDFWKMWIRRLEPTLHVVSEDFIRSLVDNFVEEHGEALELLESEVSTLSRALQEFAPLLLHPSSSEVIEEWVQEEFLKEKKEKKWHRWYQISKVLINKLVYEKNVIDSKWSAAYLQTLDLQRLQWSRRIFVDLGSEMTSVEMGLFKILSQSQDVIFLTPDPAWKNKFPYLLNIYKENLGSGKVLAADSIEEAKPLKQNQFIRLSTQAAEIKFAVAQCRKWADKGIPLENIAIVAADIEKYWPVLQQHLDEEGLTYRKDVVARLNSLGDVQNLLAVLKNYSSEVSWDSLEKSVFSKDPATEFQFEKFKGLFYQLYDQDDLGRDKKIKDLFYRKEDFSVAIDRDAFLGFLVKVWLKLPGSNSKADLFEVVFKDILGQSFNSKFKLKLWVAFLKNRLSRKEIILKRNQAGLNTLSLMSAHMTTAEYRIYLGCNDENYLKRTTSLISLTEANALKNIFDLAVESSEESYLDFNLRWQSEAATKETFYTSAHLSFASDPLNASLFFIENSPQSEIVAPEATRLDEIQKVYLAEENLAQLEPSLSVSRLREDKNGYAASLKPEVFRSLSASDLESYGQCSFKLLANKGFGLRTASQVALDLDNRDKGSFVHSLFEFLIHEVSLGDFSENKVNEFLEKERTTRGLYVNLDTVWPVQRAKFLTLARKFYDFEKQRVKIFSSEAEKKMQFYFDLKKERFVTTQPEQGFAFNLRIDRIDTHRQKNYCIVYDYKSSERAEHKATKWIDDYQFQMLLYLTALKLTLPENLVIKGSLFYYYKNFKINTGLVDQEIGLNDFLFNKRNSSLFDEGAVAALDVEFIQLVSELLKRLDKGEFKTVPYDFTICEDCDWRKLCRATHLM